LRKLGVGLALDDFGSGYSSLQALQRLPLDVLKVDRSLVAGIGRDAPALGVLRAIVALGHTLGLEVVAEGVESAAQVRPLRSLHCDLGQGYHFGRPVAAPAAEALLAAQSGWLRTVGDTTG
jgi:EAL domain-containing protein (putative c-di-GMP-specific phosphodiesterase class I)